MPFFVKCFAGAGWRVSLLDADLALANADVLLGLNPKYHLGHVLSGERSLGEVIVATALLAVAIVSAFFFTSA